MITAQQKLQSLKRELALRRTAYPKWIASGRMPKAKADYEIEVMESIVADYQEIVSHRMDAS